MFICDDVYCGGSITIMWSLNVFINDFYLRCRASKNKSWILKLRDKLSERGSKTSPLRKVDVGLRG